MFLKRLRIGAVAWLIVTAAASAEAAGTFDGSAALTSDYFVRGVSRTGDHGAFQLEVDYVNTNGVFAGIAASNTQFSNNQADAEISVFAGYNWSLSPEWRAKALLSHYAYPWDDKGQGYDYDELDLSVTYAGWLVLSANFSPNYWTLSGAPYPRLMPASEVAVDASVQRPLFGALSATAGAGYSRIGGPLPGGYVYWSAGFSYDFRPLSLSLSYIDTSAEAKRLFYDSAARGRIMATLLWRF
jgi:uncharacterized protein (TIGR02001 family)